MPGPLGTSSTYAYHSDDGNIYSVELNDGLAAQGGFTAPGTGHPGYPRRWRMRHVWGEQVDGTRGKLNIATAAFGLYVSGGSYNHLGNVYDVEGKIGEKRTRE